MKTGDVSRKKQFVFLSFIILIPCAVIFIVLEVFVRSFYPTIDLNVLTGRTVGPSPMADWAFVDAFSAYRAKPGNYSKGKTVNRHGFISTPEISVSKPAGTLRIVFLGGSSTAGTGVNLEDQETWPWKTVEMIRQQTGKNVDFINGALGGYTTFESYGRLWSRIRHFSPDLIVLYHGWNEMYYFDQVDTLSSWRTLPDGSWTFERSSIPIKRFEPLPVDSFVAWSQVLTRARLRLSKEPPGEVGARANTPLSTEFNRRGLEVWRTNLRLIKTAAEIIGAKLVVAKQATIIVKNLSESDREKCPYELHGFDHDTHVRAFQGLYDVIDQEISPEAIIDVTPISGRSEYFYDCIHPTPEATTQIAKIVSNFLTR